MILNANNKKLQKKKKNPREERKNHGSAYWCDCPTNNIIFCFDANNYYNLFCFYWICFYF